MQSNSTHWGTETLGHNKGALWQRDKGRHFKYTEEREETPGNETRPRWAESNWWNGGKQSTMHTGQETKHGASGNEREVTQLNEELRNWNNKPQNTWSKNPGSCILFNLTALRHVLKTSSCTNVSFWFLYMIAFASLYIKNKYKFKKPS